MRTDKTLLVSKGKSQRDLIPLFDDTTMCCSLPKTELINLDIGAAESVVILYANIGLVWILVCRLTDELIK